MKEIKKVLEILEDDYNFLKSVVDGYLIENDYDFLIKNDYDFNYGYDLGRLESIKRALKVIKDEFNIKD